MDILLTFYTYSIFLNQYVLIDLKFKIQVFIYCINYRIDIYIKLRSVLFVS